MKHYLPLSELCVINMGQSPDSTSYNTEKRGLPFFQGNADFGKISPHVRIWCDAPTKIAHAGDLLLSVRAPIGALNIADSDCCIGRGLAAMTCIDKKCDQRWLFFALQSKVAELQSKGTGSTFKAISKKTLFDTLLPDYPIAEQREIARNLDSLTRMIFIREKQMEKLIQLASSRFIEMFGDPIENSKGWTTRKLSEITEKIGSGATPKGGKESYLSSGITLIRSMNVYNGRFEYKDLAHITEEQAKQLDNVQVMPYDVFINITGASVARSCIVPDDVLPARVNQHVSIIRCKQNVCHPIFANSLFVSPAYQRLLLNLGESGGATRQAITKQQLESLGIILPPLSLQNKFASFIEQLDKSKVIAEKWKKRLLFLCLTRILHYGMVG